MFVPLQKIPLILVLLIFSLTTKNTTSNEVFKNSSTHEIFNVKETIAQLDTKIQIPLENQQENGTWKLKLKLIHRDKLQMSHFPYNKSKIFEGRMDRDLKRVSSLMQRITSGTGYRVDEFGSDIISGMDQGSGEYFVRIGVGSPARNQYMVLDSGSDIVWVQCQPCTQCYHQSDPVFDPSLSVSFTRVPCRSSICDRVENSGCHAGRCKYEVMYGDGSYTKAAGLLGIGGGSMSLVSQLGGQTGGAFSYCLVSRGSELTGSLEFGRGVLPVGAAWVPLIRNPPTPSFYYIGLSGLGVGGVRVAISEDVFKITDLGDGGVVMDTGTAVTRLPSEAYMAFRDAFLAATASLPRAPAVSIFDTCYDLDGFVMVRVPTVSFFLWGGQILTLPARNFLIPVNDKGTFCFAFASSPSRLSIIGNIQQEGIQISFDGANGFVGFGPNIC
ncbi:unnamed protein product [Withania somnifera]